MEKKKRGGVTDFVSELPEVDGEIFFILSYFVDSK